MRIWLAIAAFVGALDAQAHPLSHIECAELAAFARAVTIVRDRGVSEEEYLAFTRERVFPFLVERSPNMLVDVEDEMRFLTAVKFAYASKQLKPDEVQRKVHLKCMSPEKRFELSPRAG